MKNNKTLISKDRMAPGHKYIHSLGTGIQWKPGTVSLWEGGQVVETASHKTESAYDYFYNFCFADSFPSVSHWWFRSAWTQKVRLSGVMGLMDSETAWGYMQFIDGSVSAAVWTASMVDAGLTEIFAPFPPNEVQPANIPLRLALARLVAGVIADEVARDAWLVITSLVCREDLEKVFPITGYEFRWQLEDVHLSLREELCRVQGIQKPNGKKSDHR
jgi:hypothetical protein